MVSNFHFGPPLPSTCPFRCEKVWMVFLIAALYTVYQQTLQQNEGTLPEKLNKVGNTWYQTFSNVMRTSTPPPTAPPPTAPPSMERSGSGGSSSGLDTSAIVSDASVWDGKVRQEWWNAVFGQDFAPLNQPVRNVPQQGVGLASIPSYMTYQVQIPVSEQQEKLGITIHRLPLGLYARHVQPGSEAALLGIPIRSVLIDINGLSFLAEPSRSALERIWQYEGYFAEPAPIIQDVTSAVAVANHNPQPNNTQEANGSTDPYIKHPVKVRFIHRGRIFSVLFVSNPPWGITWAPCGNFPLIKRVYGQAEVSGVKRGSLVAAINETSAREMDHADAALQLRALFDQRRSIVLTGVFTPTAARTPRNPNAGKQKPTKSVDGVEVTFHPFDFSSLCSPVPTTHAQNDVHILAEQVAAGVPQPQPMTKRSFESLKPPMKESMFPACPRLSVEDMLVDWDPLASLVYCLSFAQAKYDISSYEALSVHASEEDQMQRLKECSSQVLKYVLQCISLICSPRSESLCANQLTSLLLKLSRREEDFCQLLYFMLRSFISTFETRRSATDRNLMALLHCLELLRYAEKELASRSISIPTPERVHVNSLAPSPIRASPGSPETPEDPVNTTAQQGSKSRGGMLGLFRKKKSKKQPTSTVAVVVAKNTKITEPIPRSDSPPVLQSPSMMYENMSDFLSELDRICGTVERSLQKSFRQKIAEWAMQPWSASKDSALAQVTETMRESLRQAKRGPMLLVNPVESAEVLLSVDYEECYILPSAHFPILLTFNAREQHPQGSSGRDKLYQAVVEIISVRAHASAESYVVHGAIAGLIAETRVSASSPPLTTGTNVLKFDTRSWWGSPQTLSLRLSTEKNPTELGLCWVDLSNLWGQDQSREYTIPVRPIHSEDSRFDDHGEWAGDREDAPAYMELTLRISTQITTMDDMSDGTYSRKRMLLYKHDDDLRQEAFAVQFIQICDDILKESGLDMKLLTFQCVPVGTRRGFVEWVPGSVPLSEICEPFAGSILGDHRRDFADDSDPSNRGSFTKYESFRRLQQNQAFRRLAGSKTATRGVMSNNPIQDYFRSVAYDPDAPYFIRKSVMDTFVKSCAGYCVITYLLGVGDRHLDNLLLHHSGSFFHCDYSFILGSDPKKYLPMRITEDMVYGMGGRDSDYYDKFLSLVGAVFLTLRRPEIVRVLLSLVRLMEAACLPDVSENQTIYQAVMGMRERLRLDLSDEQAITYMEELIESSLSSKMWIAVDAIHTLGKRINM